MARLLTFLRVRLAWLLFITRYRVRMVRLAVGLRPMAGAEEPADDAAADDSSDDADSDDDSAADDADDSSTDDAADDTAKPAAKHEPDWKREARKHERAAKKARDDAKKLADKLKAREDADKSEQEKAIEEAEQKARNELQGQHDKERRQDRLEVATTKLAAKGMKIGDGDDAKTVRFADPDDALLHLERDIRSGDLDEDDIFDENGKVRSDRLEDALSDLLSRKPHLAADTKPPKVKGSADGGKGEPASTDGSVDKELERIRRHKSDGDQGARFRRAA